MMPVQKTQYDYQFGGGVIGRLTDTELVEARARMQARTDRFLDSNGRRMRARDLDGKVIVYRNGVKHLNGSNV